MKNKILKYLTSNEYISGQQISSELNVSRNTIWKHIKELKSNGYIIDSVTNKGYKLISTPDILSEVEIQKDLNTDRIGKKIISFKQIDSTNEEIKRQAKNGAESGLVCTAEEQLNGKGRLGRNWYSEYGTGIWTSILLRPYISPMEVSAITLICGLAVCDSIKKVTGLSATIKWPNDVLVNNKKVCGILTEMSAQTDAVDFIVIGIGINVNNEIFSEDIAYKATSLYLESNKKVSRVELLKEILIKTEQYTDEFVTDFTSDLLNRYKSQCITIGKEVTVEKKSTTISGTAVDITNNGTLVIETENKERIEITSGEVSVQGIY